jgi:hypothetical protein
MKRQNKWYPESNLQWTVTEMYNEEKITVYKNLYMFKLFIDVVTAWFEALVLRNTFLYACVKEVCRLLASHVLIFSDDILSTRDQGCKEGYQITPSWKAPAMLECEQL